MKLNIKTTNKITLDYVHVVSKEKGQLTATFNPLTGDWLVHLTAGNDSEYSYRSLNSLKELLHSIISKNKKAGLQADLKIENNLNPVIPFP